MIITRCGSDGKLRVQFNYLLQSLLLSKECRDLQKYPTTKLIGGPCVDQSTFKNGILRSKSQCYYCANGVTLSVVGYACCEPIICCPNLVIPTNIPEHCECF